jgi:hypothetical protein
LLSHFAKNQPELFNEYHLLQRLNDCIKYKTSLLEDKNFTKKLENFKELFDSESSRQTLMARRDPVSLNFIDSIINFNPYHINPSSSRCRTEPKLFFKSTDMINLPPLSTQSPSPGVNKSKRFFESKSARDGIAQYQSNPRNFSTLNFFSALFDKDRGKIRANVYATLLDDPRIKVTSNDTIEHKTQKMFANQVILFALLVSRDGENLQAEVLRSLGYQPNHEDKKALLTALKADLKKHLSKLISSNEPEPVLPSPQPNVQTSQVITYEQLFTHLVLPLMRAANSKHAINQDTTGKVNEYFYNNLIEKLTVSLAHTNSSNEALNIVPDESKNWESPFRKTS